MNFRLFCTTYIFSTFFIQVLIAQKQQMHRSSVFVKRSPSVYEAQAIIQMEAERRRREAGVKQSMEIRLGSCMYVCMWVGMYGIWNYLANQGT